MDANQQRFWMLADDADWPDLPATGAVDYDEVRRRLRLRARAADEPAGLVDAAALAALRLRPAMAVDGFGTMAWWDAPTQRVLAAGALGSSHPAPVLCGPIAGYEARDLAYGTDEILHLALEETAGAKRSFLRLIDPRQRWTLTSPTAAPGEARGDLALVNFTAQRLAVAPDGGVWILDCGRRLLCRVRGRPLPDFEPGAFAATVFRPQEENPHPLHVEPEAQPPEFAAGEDPVAIAAAPDGRLGLLSWLDGKTYLRLRETDGRWQPADELPGAGQPASFAWLSASRFAVIPAARTPAPTCNEAVAYDLERNEAEQRDQPSPGNGFLPLLGLGERLFAKGLAAPPRYPTTGGQLAALLPLSVAGRAAWGTAVGRVIDSGNDATAWHRLYLEASLPPHCGIVVELSATDDPAVSIFPASERFAHHFGETSRADTTERPPLGVWLPDRSEIPHHGGLLCCAPSPQHCGLFTALIQRSGRRVRALAGRYLHVRITLYGTGHTTPELAALRAYGPRYSYRDHYLPELYREELFGADADAGGAATPADFLERFLGLFESVLTPLEDRVAQAQVLMDPHSTPAEALNWLGSWLGVVFEPAFPESRRRAWLAAVPRLYQTRGTLAGLQLALEIATGGRIVREVVGGRECEYPTGGDVSKGRILVIEDFRLRRTMATILGADLTVEDDPLLPGLLFSSNSLVGDTLILGEEQRKEFLALFRDGYSRNAATRRKEKAAVASLYDRLAHRVTILVHNELAPVDLGLIRRIAILEAPAHLTIKVEPATWPLLVGLASLVEVDTCLTPTPPRGLARLNSSHLGQNAFVRRTPALDPRLTF
jgi:phage tail-like protein